MHYLRQFSTRQTSQSRQIPGTTQAPNSAGGYAWRVDGWERLYRFLILGSEGGSYYATEQKLTAENADAVVRCIAEDGPRTVREIALVSRQGRAPKNDPAIFALALCASATDDTTRKAALDVLPEVCRIGTHLFHFVTYVEQFRGWGRGLRKAIGNWYTEKDPDDLAYQLVKYRQRDGWSHRDLLRLAKPRPERDSPTDLALRWAVGKADGREDILPDAIHAYEDAQGSAGPAATVNLIRSYGDKLPREALNPDHLTDPNVWDALLYQGMPMTALIRNLATMTRVGLLTPTSQAMLTAVDQITDADRLCKARVHPIQVLAAMLTYASGQSARGSNAWTPVAQIVDALDHAFYVSFDNVEPTGKRWLIGLDVSGSMDSGVVAGVPGLTPRVTSSAMAMVTMATGDPYEVVAFTSGGSNYATSSSPALTVLPFSPRQRLDDICRATDGLPFGGTDCALPMLHAMGRGSEVDAFAIYTDNETWAGQIHPAQALVRYRQQSGIDAKLIVVGMVSNGFSIADPNDKGMLDVVGFDTATPQVIAQFAGSM